MYGRTLNEWIPEVPDPLRRISDWWLLIAMFVGAVIWIARFFSRHRQKVIKVLEITVTLTIRTSPVLGLLGLVMLIWNHWYDLIPLILPIPYPYLIP